MQNNNVSANDDDPLMQMRMPMMEVDNDDSRAEDDEMVVEEEEEEAVEADIDRTMVVTHDEIVAAHEIKLSFQQEGGGGGGGGGDDEETPQLRPLTDYEYMQYALTTYDETPEQRLHRAHTLQAFREQYNIQDTVEEGVQILDEFSRDVWPGFLLQFEKVPSPNNNNVSIVCMSTNCQYWEPSRIGDSQQKWRLFMGTFYYSLQLRMCNFAAIRIGGSVLAECGDVGHHQYDESFSTRFAHELHSVYPCNHEQLLFLNTPSIINFGYACLKKCHTKEWQRKLVLGYKIPGFDDDLDQAGGQGQFRLQHLYQTPTPEIARQRMLHNARQILEERYRNQRNYVLPP